MLSFPLERKFLTQQLLRNEYLQSLESFLYNSLSIEIDINHLEIVKTADLRDDSIRQAVIHMKQDNETSTAFESHGVHYLVMAIEENQFLFILQKNNEFLPNEIQFAKEFRPLIENILTSAANISTHAFEESQNSYTPYEKSIFMNEVSLSEKYQSFIAHFLHDEVLQSVLSIRQSVYQNDSSKAVQASVEHADEEIETSIRRKMIEWEASNIPEQSLKASIGHLVQKLVTMYDKAIFVQIDIADSLDLPVNFQQFVFRSIRELLVNVYKHSNATRVNITLDISSTDIDLLVIDDGKGISQKSAFKEKNTFGLYSIYQQAQAFNGSMELFDSHIGGLGVKMIFPLETLKKGSD